MFPYTAHKGFYKCLQKAEPCDLIWQYRENDMGMNVES